MGKKLITNKHQQNQGLVSGVFCVLYHFGLWGNNRSMFNFFSRLINNDNCQLQLFDGDSIC